MVIFLLLIIICPIAILYFINKLFFSQKKPTDNYLDWIILGLIFAFLTYVLYKFSYGAEGAIVRGIIGLSFFVAFVFGIIMFFISYNKIKAKLKLKLLITLIILLIIGFSVCNSDGIFY